MGDPDAHRHDVMRTAYRFAAGFDDTPWMLLTSWEPLSLTRGTVISFPESGPHAGQSIPHRMAAIGITVDTWREDVCARPASPDEAKRFDIAKGSILIVIERAYYAGDQVVEVADIIVPAEATKLVYNGPVGDR
ncbi:UTRA domain-containing protein [Nonomuraea sp. NPDC050404]|uniref:UTRA domain-containing protein n=1 Tax=Nonomuraea sp. NPDC050404 TaxID=3155783 RepID=UPI0033D56858